MSATDKLRLASNGTQAVPTSLASPMAFGATTATLNVATGWPTATGVDVVMYLVDTSGTKVAGSQTSWVFQLTGTTLSGGVLKSGTMPAAGYPSGSSTVVTVRPTAAWGNDVINALLGVMNQDGTLKSAPVKTALGVSSTTGGGWDILNAGTAPTVSSGYNHGNKEFALTFSGVDLTSVLSAGMRLKFDRSTPAPTQCMAFTAASSQYASKTSPTGISFTTAFTTEAWVYLNSYTGAIMNIGGRYNGTNGFFFQILASGQLVVGGDATTQTSYQSVPLKRFVHVAGTYAAGTMNLYINGVLVPSFKSGSGTSLTQAGNMQIGALNSTGFFDGYISEFRVWSAAQTATQIQDNMAVSLTGSETNLVGLWQGNGAFTDKTANANTMTATGGAVATQAANPYNTTEYALVSTVTYATSNTTVVVHCGENCNIPLATLTNPFSSYADNPFGWAGIKWEWTALLMANFSSSGTAQTAVSALSIPCTVPGGRKAELSLSARDAYQTGGGVLDISIWDGVVGSGTQIADTQPNVPNGSATPVNLASQAVSVGPTAAAKTYNVGIKGATASANIEAGTTYPAVFKVVVK